MTKAEHFLWSAPQVLNIFLLMEQGTFSWFSKLLEEHTQAFFPFLKEYLMSRRTWHPSVIYIPHFISSFFTFLFNCLKSTM